ncbi:lipase 3-like [Teleopsis dalmanni]|uniref:lipase 3-like n=1 Tax=Teleopsis dalmanni TaxID=139649 RepID=UPI000D32C19E|nr:lipase 3-like [Teleopsis dalmanni]
MLKYLLAAVVIVAVSGTPLPEARKFLTTSDRVQAYGYPSETHEVQTGDGYILTLFRIPYSPKLNNKNKPRGVVFLQHGLLSSSDCWILNGPENALAFLLADEGFDVWMGNARGNTYSKDHTTKSSWLPPFWDFSWHEIGLHDIPTMLDYVLFITDERELHYVGHSQGTTAFMVMLSQLPRYNSKIKTAHMLAPVGYMTHMTSPFAIIAAPLLGQPTLLSELIGSSEFMPSNKLLSLLGSQACKDKAIFQPMCENILFLMGGWDSSHLNSTLMPEICQTHPAGSSTKQLLHYLQEFNSGHYRQYDHGKTLNKSYYKQKNPPDYFIENIRPLTPLQFYYSDNDYFAAVVDVEQLADELGRNVDLHHVKYEDWNHLDYLWAIDVKETIYDDVIERINAYES